MQIKTTVFVTSVAKKNGKVIVEASNGGPDGPPKIVFELGGSLGLIQTLFLDKRLTITIED
jgi:hypothetical protein